jgi:hypothetical protein
MRLISKLFLLTWIFSTISFADTLAKPQPFVISSGNSPYFMKMVPNKFGGGYAAAFKLLDNASAQALWRVEGYSFEAYLSNDGQHFIRIGPWASGREPSDEDVAVEFFSNGELLKSYSTNDLIKDASSVRPTSGHYFWRAKDGDYTFLSSNNFHLKTVDGISYIFDVTTGEIISD